MDLLNEDLGTEYQSIVQYTNHIATITGSEYLSILDELEAHVGEELSHAEILAEEVLVRAANRSSPSLRWSGLRTAAPPSRPTSGS